MPPRTITFPDQYNDDDLITTCHHDTAESFDNNKKALSPKSCRTVTFAPFADVQEIPNINDMPNINTIWYSDSEFAAIQRDINETIWAMEFGCPLNEQDQCTRGLESRTRSNKHAKGQQILSGLNSVLDEQDLQRDEGVHDPELLADVYFAATYKCQKIAEKLALQDCNQILR